MAKIVDIAAQIHEEIGEPTDISITSISFWLQTNVGALNVALNSSFSLDENTLEIGGLGEEEAAILKKMYECYFYGKRYKENLGATGTDNVISVMSDGASVRKINKNEVAKNYLAAQKDCKEQINMMIKGYKRFVFKPVQIVGDDSIEEGTISSDTANVRVDERGQLLS